MTMKLHVEFTAGTTLQNAVKEAKALADWLNVGFVCFKFNGTEFLISADAVVYDVMAQYHNNESPIIS